jgi:hypothetical protein
MSLPDMCVLQCNCWVTPVRVSAAVVCVCSVLHTGGDGGGCGGDAHCSGRRQGPQCCLWFVQTFAVVQLEARRVTAKNTTTAMAAAMDVVVGEKRTIRESWLGNTWGEAFLGGDLTIILLNS